MAKFSTIKEEGKCPYFYGTMNNAAHKFGFARRQFEQPQTTVHRTSWWERIKKLFHSVVPAKAGIQLYKKWIPGSSPRVTMMVKHAPRKFAITVLAFVITGAGFLVYNKIVQADWYNTTWGFRKPITINYTKVSSTQTNFPVLVSIIDTSLAANAQSTGSDILFTSSNGTTKLSHEIESYDATTGRLTAWVKIPSLSSTADTMIYMYYGNQSAANQQDAVNVWDTNTKAVWHLDEDPSGSSPQMSDSTGVNNGTTNGMVAGNSVDSQIYKGLSFDGSNDYVNGGNNSSLNNTTNSITLSAWVKRGASNSTGYLINRGTAGASGYALGIGNNDSSGCGTNVLQVSKFNVVHACVGAMPADTNWHHIVAVMSGSGIIVYVDGAQSSPTNANTTSIVTSTNSVRIGADASGAQRFTGSIDEARIANTARSAGWIATEYNNQSDPSTFYTLGNQQQKKNPVLYWKFDEGSGAIANDASGMSNNGAISGATWQNKDVCLFEGNCLKFDGTSSNVSKTYAADAELDVDTGSFSVAAWFRHPTSASGTDTIIARADGVNGVGYKIYYDASSTRLCFGIDSAAGSFPSDAACSQTSYADNKWHYVEAVKNGTSTIKLYIDGEEKGVDGSITSGSLSGVSAPFYVGMDADGSSNPWEGYLDEVKIYDYARNEAEVKADYNAKGAVLGAATSLGGIDANSSLSQGLVGYWRMDDGVGNPCPQGVDKACDSSGNNNVGTWNGNTASTSGKFGYATNFDGTSDYVHVSGLLGNNATITLAAWVNVQTPTDPSADVISLNDRIVLRAVENGTGSTVNGFFYDGTTWRSTTSTRDIRGVGWVHLVYVFDDANHTQKLYANGELIGSSAYAGSIVYGSGNTAIGRNGSGGSSHDFSGKIDDARVYNRALSPREITNLYDWAPGPVGHWKMDEKNGTTAQDSSGYGNPAILDSGVTWIGGKYGGALQFDVSENAEVNATNFKQPKTAVTVAAWVNIQQHMNWINIIQRQWYDVGTNSWLLHTDANGDAIFGVSDAVPNQYNAMTTTPLATNRWYHLEGTYDGTTVRLYVDGVLVGTNTRSGLSFTPISDFSIGNGFVKVDDVKIYDYARTAKQVVQDMNGGHPSVGSPVGSALHHYKFDDGNGNVASNSGSLGKTVKADLYNFDIPATTGSGWTNNGKFGKALQFDGTNDFVRITSPSLPTTDFTYSVWVKPDTVNDETILMASNTGGTNELGVYIGACTDGSGKVCLMLNDSGSDGDIFDSSVTVQAGQWYHIVITRSGSAVKFYLNGKHSATANYGSTLDFNACPLHLGVDVDGSCTGGLSNFFDGTMDEFKAYNYALNANEVKVEYNNGKGITLGASSTGADNKTPDNSAARSYCPPGNAESNCSGAGGLNPAPIAEWKFEEKKGIHAIDSSGNNLDATLANGTTWAGGKIGSGVQFDGVNDSIDISSTLLNFGGTQAYSISFWMNSSAANGTYEGVISKDSNSRAGWEIIRDSASNTIIMERRNSGGTFLADCEVPFTPGVWTHMTFSYDGTMQRCYANAMLVDDEADTGSMGTTSDALTMGTFSNSSEFWDGKLDNVRIYNYVRTQSQVAWDYNQGKPFGYYKFDECTGNTVYNAAVQPIATWSAALTYGTRSGPSGSNTSSGTCGSGSGSEAWANGVNGKFNSSLDFDGTDDAVLITDNNFGNFGVNQDFTISSWVKTTQTMNGDFPGIVYKESTTNQTGWGINLDRSNANGLWFGSVYVNNTGYFAYGASRIDDGQWHHLVFQRAGSVIRTYQDGKLAKIASATVSDLSNGSNIRIGNTSFGDPYDGQIDETMLFNYALSPAQIKVLYNQNSAVRFAPPTGRP